MMPRLRPQRTHWLAAPRPKISWLTNSDHLDVELLPHEIHGLLARHLVVLGDLARLDAASADAAARALDHDRDVHAEDADLRVVLHPREIGVVGDAEVEVPAVVERVVGDLELADVEGPLQEGVRVLAAQRHAHADGAAL